MQNRNKLIRSATLKDVIVHYITSVLGIGLIISPSLSYYLAGNQALYTWVFLAAISIPISFIFIWLAIKYGEASSISLFIKEAFGDFMARLVSCCLILTMFVGNPIMSLTSAHYIVSALSLPDQYFIWITVFLMCISLLCVALKLTNFLRVQRALMFVFIIIFVSSCLYSLLSSSEKYLNVPDINKNTLSALSMTFFVCFIAFTGWENGITIIGEMKYKARSLYTGTIVASNILVFLYLLAFFANQSYIDRRGSESDAVISLRFLFEGNFGEIGVFLINIIVPTILFLSSNAWVYGTSRLIYSLSRNKYLPDLLSKTYSNSGVPLYALALMFIAYMLTLIIFSIFSLKDQDLVFMYSFGSYIVFSLTFLSGIKIFKSWQKFITSGVFLIFIVLVFNVDYNFTLAVVFISVCIVLTLLFWLFRGRNQ